MTSCTSNSKHYRHFSLMLLAVVAMAMAGVLLLGVYLQPINGSSNDLWLVRNGGYAARDYGWNQAQTAFITPLYTHERYDQPVDIVILGDSFTDLYLPYQWQNYLAAAANASVTVFSLRRGARLNDVLQHPVFQIQPPKLFIYEVAERYLDLLINREQACSVPVMSPLSPVVPNTLPIVWENVLNQRTRVLQRDTSLHANKIAETISQVKKYLWRNALRDFLGLDITDTLRHPLNRPAPFSSHIQDALLTASADIHKQSWNNDTVESIVCAIAHARRQIEANGKTRFVMLIAPDKLTAYADFLTDSRWRLMSRYADIAVRLPDSVVRLDSKMHERISHGDIDVYLPDDTHWGSRGHQLAAEAVLNFVPPAAIH